MKKITIFLSMTLLAAIIFSSCKKGNDVSTPKELDLTNNLAFKNYVAMDMLEKLKVISYNVSNMDLGKNTSLKQDLLKTSSIEEMGKVYNSYSLDINVLKRFVFSRTARQLKLLEKIPELRSETEEQLSNLINANYAIVSNQLFEHARVNAIEKMKENNGVEKPDMTGINAIMPGFKKSKPVVQFISPDENINPETYFETIYSNESLDLAEPEIQGLVDIGLITLIGDTAKYRITADEVISCAKEAFMALVGSITGIVQLDKLIAIEGVSAAVRAVGSFIVRNSGWVTAGIVAADFGFCMYMASLN